MQAHYGVRVNEMIMCASAPRASCAPAGWLRYVHVCVSIPLTFKSRQHDATIGSSRTYFLYFAEVINLEKQTPTSKCARELFFNAFTRPVAKKLYITI